MKYKILLCSVFRKRLHLKVYGHYSPGGGGTKRKGPEAKHSLPSNDLVKNTRTYIHSHTHIHGEVFN
jgi:hypothetical protein